jgi:hypothetical protein
MCDVDISPPKIRMKRLSCLPCLEAKQFYSLRCLEDRQRYPFCDKSRFGTMTCKNRQARIGEREKTPEWEPQDEIHMLAYLDHQLFRLGMTDKWKLKEGIVQDLQKSRGKEFTMNRVDVKLKQIQQQYCPKRKKENILTRGSKCLRTLDKNVLAEIEKMTIALRDEHVADILKWEPPRRSCSLRHAATSGTRISTARELTHARSPSRRKSEVSVHIERNGYPAKRHREVSLSVTKTLRGGRQTLI